MILSGIEKNMEDISHVLITNINNLKKNQLETKYTITKIWNQLDVMTTRMKEVEEWISDIEDKIMENDEAEQRRELWNMRLDLGNSVTPSNLITFIS